ncbi:MAG: hypothetical protein A3B99_00720 [Candidatus Yanofskybacteria bacterium RIFCSPHIGHO2_02_FULL_44_12b]|uniref:Uncharacterized protein n=2 Tax=Candidatus Yanofskyibacteriota TaxID=1752733 RepID=A0A1F8GJD8_9BACT|nr:MAG: hypothetical protein UW79_C0004G0010 [Candidatus Yanofskybacteria bacterium GW2011_GWA2_44_9]OGN05349.1 MAG: hypothetical protein A2659_01980 [Candidatus Yanofskybacteria bacterium RIFCSPHIGHO2_01_FULL_44_24]OGN16001.1 MAG: hypothetical protein A3B99_00720 [Candidatus Yanofskybacteria bacterium RIFCSPHIGHO2_02_FULL_44_12b]OGN25512.1 MAG: hypothetical protein A2925_02165 [Candidatus Yanofskybacteria bacterium RIFCSPLOWO2_01_FULL_44_22]
MFEGFKFRKEKRVASEEVVAWNLEKLRKDMVDLLMTESIGGNAGAVDVDGKKYSCGGANGYANSETGEIIVFGNIQDIQDKKILENSSSFTLRVALDRQRGFFKITEILFGSDHISGAGRLAIEEAVKRWNDERRLL